MKGVKRVMRAKWLAVCIHMYRYHLSRRSFTSSFYMYSALRQTRNVDRGAQRQGIAMIAIIDNMGDSISDSIV